MAVPISTDAAEDHLSAATVAIRSDPGSDRLADAADQFHRLVPAVDQADQAVQCLCAVLGQDSMAVLEVSVDSFQMSSGHV